MKVIRSSSGLFFRLLLLLLLLSSTVLSASSATASIAAAQQPDGTENLPDGIVSETVLSDMYMPAGMAFDGSGRLFYTEKNTGNVRLFADGVLQVKPVISFEVGSCAERGLTGIVLDPAFSSSHYIYVYYAEGLECQNTVNKVVRFTEVNGVGYNPITLFTSPAYDQYHMGGGLHFGPDGKLYVTIGDTSNSALAQDLTVPQGKVHRLNPDGSAPADNPKFSTPGALPTIFAYGFRNTYNLTSDPISGKIFGGENGPDCDDEMNLIEPGNNYGWRPDYACEDETGPDSTYNNIPSLWHTVVCCVAPTGITFYTGDQIPSWKNSLFMGTFYGKLYHYSLEDDRTTLRSSNVINGIMVNMSIATGPDGAFYYIEGGGSRLGVLKRLIGPTFQESMVKAEQARDPYAAPVPIPGDESYTFAETGKTLNGMFLQYWRENGGLAQLGYPISDVIGEVSDLNKKLYSVQYFERAIFEYHPELNPPFKVLLTQLGRLRYKTLYPEGAPDQQPSIAADAVLVPETGKYLGGTFLDYWQRTGGVTSYGYPISDEFTEISETDGKPYTVQYFERAVFELHPENAAPFNVELSHLGRFAYQAKHETVP